MDTDSVVAIAKIFVGLAGDPFALLSLLAFGALGLAAWAIYALIVTVRARGGE